MLLQVHDELLFEIEADRLAAVTPHIVTQMEAATAEVIVSEIGTDMSRFPTPGHLAASLSASAPTRNMVRIGPKWKA